MPCITLQYGFLYCLTALSDASPLQVSEPTKNNQVSRGTKLCNVADTESEVCLWGSWLFQQSIQELNYAMRFTVSEVCL